MQGFLNIIKPTGMNSTAVVSRVKKILNEKVGHLGTLDPSATGVLPIAVGKATKLFDYFLKKDKEYYFVVKFGVLTDTLDSDGKIIERKENVVSCDKLSTVCGKFIGKINQIPPVYSAKVVNGVKSYDLARKNVQVELKPKEVEIYDLKFIKQLEQNCFLMKLNCSSGTYVRSVVRDLAKELDAIAICVSIIRTKSGLFDINKAICLDDDFKENLIKINEVLKLKEYEIDKNQAKDLFSGKTIPISLENGNYMLVFDNKDFALAECENGKLKNQLYLYEGENIW